MRNKQPEKPVSAIPLELPIGKFEISLPFDPVYDEFAVECEAAWHLGGIVICQDVPCRVYHFGADSIKRLYHIGLVRAE